MEVLIEDNPNCPEEGQYIFNEIAEKKPVDKIVVSVKGEDAECDVIGVDQEGQFIQAYAQKVNDSGEGVAYLIYGGLWGIRIKLSSNKSPWSLDDSTQWGEAYKVYASEDDLIYKN